MNRGAGGDESTVLAEVDHIHVRAEHIRLAEREAAAGVVGEDAQGDLDVVDRSPEFEFRDTGVIMTALMKTHQAIDQRSLALARAVARRLGDNPALITKARAAIRRWLDSASPRVRPTLLEWDELLQGPVTAVQEVLTGTSERAVRLRQSNPFAGALSPSERSAILKEFAAYDAASA